MISVNVTMFLNTISKIYSIDNVFDIKFSNNLQKLYQILHDYAVLSEKSFVYPTKILMLSTNKKNSEYLEVEISIIDIGDLQAFKTILEDHSVSFSKSKNKIKFLINKETK